MCTVLMIVFPLLLSSSYVLELQDKRQNFPAENLFYFWLGHFSQPIHIWAKLPTKA